MRKPLAFWLAGMIEYKTVVSERRENPVNTDLNIEIYAGNPIAFWNLRLISARIAFPITC